MPRRTFNDMWASGGAKTDPGGVKTALGWIAEKPPYQYFNWVMNKVEEMLQHLERRGVPVWDAATVYDIHGVCSGSDGHLYVAVASSTNVNPVGTVVAPTYATASWRRLTPPSTESAVGIIEIATNAEVLALSDTGRGVTPSGLNALAASTTQRGIAELATGAEAAALTDAARVVTPLALASLVASETAKGIVELATSAEVLTGTDATRAVTPQALGSLSQLLANPGYKKFPGGLIVQWGNNDVDSTNNEDVAFATPFLSAVYAAVCGGHIGGLGETGPHFGARIHPTTPLTHVRLSSSFNNEQVSWVCIGV